MGPVRLVVTVICLAAFGAAVGLEVAVAQRHETSGQAALTRSARALTDALSAPRVDAAAVQALLAPGADLEDPRVRRVIQTLASALRSPSMVTRVSVSDGGAGTSSLRVLEGGRLGLGTSDLTLSWVRRPDGRWGFDPLPR